jgi:tyrosyl-tRNA synthetase
MSTTKPIDLLDELRWRGLIHQCTDEAGLRAHLADPANAPRSIYAGFDPTAPSLTIGNLVPIMLLAHVKRAGHRPVVVMGGGTGLIGDPSGKSAERTLMTKETVEKHVAAQRPIFDAVLGHVDGPGYTVLNNADWLTKISYLDALRDIGKHFSVNMMMAKESVRARLEDRDHGISYTEFSYMILQAYDFLHLYRRYGVTVQLGGSDQFGNIVAGIDLIRRRLAVRDDAEHVDWVSHLEHELLEWASISEVPEYKEIAARSDANDASSPDLDDDWRKRRYEIVREFVEMIDPSDPEELLSLASAWSRGHDLVPSEFRAREYQASFGLTSPLVTKADGGKFGKTETGAVWLTADRTTPYAYFQFWLNASDADAANWIKIFTFLDKPAIDALLAAHAANPGARELQRTLAREATAILHGREQAERAEAAGKALFSGDIAHLDEATLREILADAPSSEFDRADLEPAGDRPAGYDLVALLTATGLAKSNREAREFLSSGSVSINGAKVGPDDRLLPSHLLHGSLAAIRRGKKHWHLTRWG